MAGADPSVGGGGVNSSRIARRINKALLLTALLPVLVSLLLAQSMVRQSSARFFLPEIGERLDASLELYKELAKEVKSRMRHQATALAENSELRLAVREADHAQLETILEDQIRRNPSLVSVGVEKDGEVIAEADRGRPLEPARENRLLVPRPLGGDSEATLVVVFAAEKARFEQRDEMSRFLDQYATVESRREHDEESYLLAFGLLLGITILAAMGVGTRLARGVSSRIGELASATRLVGAGDMSIRVEERGQDEITDLAVAFNRMVGEVEDARARLEYMERIAAWQEMARRLAHEIKNPLTPIQLAVQEIHQRYPDADESYRKLLDVTLEIVEAEVGTLRRLVGDFSDFARLSESRPEADDLFEFLADQYGQLGLSSREMEDGEAPLLSAGVGLEYERPSGAAPVLLDRQMLRRCLINIIGNASQAVSGDGKAGGTIRITAGSDRDYVYFAVEDDGPGIPQDHRARVFDPYVTSKAEGTGLGLAIVKKVIVEHSGTIEAGESALGGARFAVRFPKAREALGAEEVPIAVR